VMLTRGMDSSVLEGRSHLTYSGESATGSLPRNAPVVNSFLAVSQRPIAVPTDAGLRHLALSRE
jgi:hypothetical protein